MIWLIFNIAFAYSQSVLIQNTRQNSWNNLPLTMRGDQAFVQYFNYPPSRKSRMPRTRVKQNKRITRSQYEAWYSKRRRYLQRLRYFKYWKYMKYLAMKRKNAMLNRPLSNEKI
eukprot:NODE_342_length_10579_cov_0.629389.p4 type:complete len:114 gc:universal NODE_342_length_10579_cov_0.629389:9698-9357(-)